MTELFDRAIAKLQTLSENERDAIAAMILEKIEEDRSKAVETVSEQQNCRTKIANEPIDDLESVRYEALRKLGRNIVNFSKIESGFKHLLVINQMKGDLKDVSVRLKEKKKKLKKLTLGSLVREFHQNNIAIETKTNPIELVENISKQENYNKSNEEISKDYNGKIFFLFNIIFDDEEIAKKYKQTFSNIVTERNKLIHQDIALIDINDIEHYRKLIILLDEQNLRLLNCLDDLRETIETIGEMWEDFKLFLKSPEFRKYIEEN